jgi:hypothetical protein
MIILFNDRLQESNMPGALKSAALADALEIKSPLVITLPAAAPVSAIGIGNTDGGLFVIKFNDAGNTRFEISFNGNGLYPMNKTVKAGVITVDTDANFIGRIAAGIGVNIPTSIAKQPGWNSTSEPRVTLSGQAVPGAGGYNYRTLSLDSRYKIGPLAVSEIAAGYKHTGLGFPFFIDLTQESYKLPYSKLYASEQNQRSWALEGGAARFLYSYRFNFSEAF